MYVIFFFRDMYESNFSSTLSSFISSPSDSNVNVLYISLARSPTAVNNRDIFTSSLNFSSDSVVPVAYLETVDGR